MKTLFTLIFVAMATIYLPAQTSQYIHTNGGHIFGPCGDSLLLRGLNYAPYNWGFDINSLEINEISQTGANVVRMDWYYNNADATTDAVYKNYVALDSAISKCVHNKMIAVIEIHDYTCSNDTASLLNLNTWWTQTAVFTNVLNKYKQSVIVNYANEALYFDFASNPTAALNTYKNTYQQIITALRSVNGFNFPIMIDGPDCGANSDAFITSSVANDLIQFDPQHNLIFSAHAYWYAFAGNDSAQMASKINALLAQNIPLVLGEVANLQDDVNPCQYTLNYQPLLKYCQQKKVNWIAWSWDHDNCPARQISSSGNFSSLTAYGNDIVNNSVYGLLTVGAPKSQFLISPCTTGINDMNSETHLILYPNPATNVLTIETPLHASLEISNMQGALMKSFAANEAKTNFDHLGWSSCVVNISSFPVGVFIVKVKTEKGVEVQKFVKE